MYYEFPYISHIDQVLEAIAGKDEFIVKHDIENNYKVINYLVNYDHTFPIVTDHQTAILRECRGIKFDATTGLIISRPFHKFFNINERFETNISQLDFNKNHVVLHKLDGSMLCPIMLNDKIRWCTKMGLTEVAKPVERFYDEHPIYHKFVEDLVKTGNTPIFEWTSRQQRIILDYVEENLVLTAIRQNTTGMYLGYYNLKRIANNSNIPVVQTIETSLNNIDEFLKSIYEMKEAEGVVVRFDNGHMLKVKGEWYVNMHKTMEHLFFEKDVIRLIINNEIDDAKPYLPEDQKTSLDNFASDLLQNIAITADKIFWIAQSAYDNLNGSKKRFAIEIINSDKWNSQHSPLLYKTFDNLNQGVDGVKELILSTINSQVSSQTKINQIRHLFGNILWDNYRKR